MYGSWGVQIVGFVLLGCANADGEERKEMGREVRFCASGLLRTMELLCRICSVRTDGSSVGQWEVLDMVTSYQAGETKLFGMPKCYTVLVGPSHHRAGRRSHARARRLAKDCAARRPATVENESQHDGVLRSLVPSGFANPDISLTGWTSSLVRGTPARPRFRAKLVIFRPCRQQLGLLNRDGPAASFSISTTDKFDVQRNKKLDVW